MMRPIGPAGQRPGESREQSAKCAVRTVVQLSPPNKNLAHLRGLRELEGSPGYPEISPSRLDAPRFGAISAPPGEEFSTFADNDAEVSACG